MTSPAPPPLISCYVFQLRLDIRESLITKKRLRGLHSSWGRPSFRSPLTKDSCAGQELFFYLKTFALGVVGKARRPARHWGELERSVLLDWMVGDL